MNTDSSESPQEGTVGSFTGEETINPRYGVHGEDTGKSKKRKNAEFLTRPLLPSDGYVIHAWKGHV